MGGQRPRPTRSLAMAGPGDVPARVLIVDDHAPTRRVVVRLLEEEFTVAGQLADAESLIEEWLVARPDVIGGRAITLKGRKR